jgi:hypothetical protein
VPLWGYVLLAVFLVVGLSRTDQGVATWLVVGFALVAIVIAMGVYGGLN